MTKELADSDVEAAVALLYADCVERVKAMLRRRGAPPEAAEDVCHDAFLALLCRIDRLPDGWQTVCNPDYLFRIAFNLFSRPRRKQELFIVADPSIQDPRVRDPDDALALQEALGGLPERRRQVVELVCLQGYSYKQAGEIMHVSQQTVANHLRKARADLGQWFDPTDGRVNRPGFDGGSRS